jgi:uncharacterized repeat protein (TIGR02543 family)
MAWYRKNSANAGVNANKWVKIAQVYRKDSDAAGGQWRKIRRIFVYNGGVWRKVHDSDSLNPVNTVPPTLESNYTGALYYGAYMHGSTLTLTRGTWTGNVTGYALSIQKSVGGDDPLNYSAVSSGTGTSLTYTIPLASARAPSDWYRGKVVATNSFGSTDSFVGKFISRINAEVTYFFTTMTGHAFQASWTTNVAPQTSGSNNILSQTIQILSNDTFTHNGTSYSPNSVVYSVSYPITSSQVEQINFQNVGIKQNQSYYAKIIVVANDTSETTFSEIGDDFTYVGVPVIGAFNITSFTKGTVSASSQGATRSTTINWETATNASKYSVEYQGRNSTSDNWQDAEFFIPFVNAPTTSKTQSFTSNQTPSFYTFIRARIRASNDQGSTMIYNTPVGGSSYIEAVGTAPGQPSFGTITKTDTTASIPVTAGSQGSNYRYEQMEYQYRTSSGSYSGTWSTQVLSSGSGTIPLSNLSSNQLYYIKIRNRNQDEIYSPENETTFQTNVALTGATSTSISSMSRLSDSTVQVVIGSSGAGGPYYQLYWNSGAFSSIPTTSYYDAASTSSTVTEIMSPPSGTSYYFLIRSSDQNLGDTTASGSQNSGSYSSYGPTSSPATYTFASPGGATSSVSGSSTVGSTLTLTANSPTSAAPTASMTSIVWRVNDGGFGGNSFTGGSVLQNGGTTFVIPQYLYGSVSSVGYSIRAEVTWNNGVGSQIANSTATAVTAAGVAPSGGSVTLSPSGTQQAGTTITANVSAMSGTATISYTTTLRKKTGSAPTSSTDGTEVASGTGTGNVASHTITTSEASGTPDQFRAFTTGTNSFGNNTVSSNTVISTPAVVAQYTVTWNAAGGTVSPASNSVTAGSSVTAPTPSRSGYTFDYWYDNSFSYIVYAGNSFTPPNTITMNASWTQVVVQTPAITSGPFISWASGNNFTLSATASNATNIEFEVQFGNNDGGPVLSTQTFFMGASAGSRTTGAQSYSWARTRAKANNISTGLSSSFTGYTAWA